MTAGCRRATIYDGSGTSSLVRGAGSCDEKWVGALGPERGWLLRDGALYTGTFGERGAVPVSDLKCRFQDAAPVANRWLELCGSLSVLRGEGAEEDVQFDGTARFGRAGEPVSFTEMPFGGVFSRAGSTIGFAGPVHAWHPTDDGVLIVSGGDLHWADTFGSRRIMEGQRFVAVATGADDRVAAILDDGRLVTFLLDRPLESARARVERWSERVRWLAAPEREGRLTGADSQDDILSWLQGQLLEMGLEPDADSFELPRFAPGELSLRVDSEEVSSGFAALPTSDEVVFEGKPQVVALPSDWATLRALRAERRQNSDAPLFLVTTRVNELTPMPVEEMVWASGPPAILVTPELGDRLEAARRVELTYRPVRNTATSASVFAEIPATGTARRDVVMIAHWDHLGSGGFASNDDFGVRSFPGADDNASGVASLLDLAESLAESPLESTRVTVLFTGGEEVGFLGARSWVERYEEADRADLVVNLDMIGRLDDARVFASDDFPTEWLDPLVRASAAAGWPIAEVSPLEDGAYSDHLVFGDAGSPLLFFHDLALQHWHKGEDRPGSLEPEAAFRATHSVLLFLRSIDASARRDLDRGDVSPEEIGESVGP